MDRWFRKLQLLSSALFSFSHGSNDAQKTIGIITGVLLSAGYLKTFEVTGLGGDGSLCGHRFGDDDRRLAHRSHDGRAV